MSEDTRPFDRNSLRRLGRELRLHRQRAGLTQPQLAGASGLSARAIRDIESGRSSPGLATALAVARALGVSLDELVTAARQSGNRVVSRAGEEADRPGTDLTRDLPQPRLRAELVRLAPRAMHVEEKEAAAQASFCFVVEGSVAVSLSSGEVVRLRKGDSYHALPGAVRGVMVSGGTPARLLAAHSASADHTAQSQPFSGHGDE